MIVARRCLIVAGVITALFFYYFYVYDNFHEVIEGKIYRSAQLSDDRLHTIIRENNLKAIINLRGESHRKKWYRKEKQTADKFRVRHFSFRFSAHKLPNCSELDGFIEALKRAPRPLLLHCKLGADRAGLASALALSMETNSPLRDLKKQFSLYYGVLPFSRSTGTILFSEYEGWLNQTGHSHNWETLAYWIRNVYVDSQGNMEYSVDLVEGIKFKSKERKGKRVVTLQRPLKTISIYGWAFFRCKNMPVRNLSLILSNGEPRSVDFSISRPDVAEFFDLKKEAFPNFKVGWVVVVDGSDLANGCNDIFLSIENQKRKPQRIPTGCSICIED